jgi:hypothetical protein
MYIMDHLRVSVVFATVIRLFHKNIDKIWTYYQTVLVKPLDVTMIILSALHGCKMSDYVLLKTHKIYIVVNNK